MHAILLSSKFDKLPVIPRRRRRLLLLALVVRHLHKLSEHPSQLFSNPSCDRISFFCHLELDMTWGQRPISYVFVQLLNWHQYYEQCHRPAHSAAAWPLGCYGCFGRERRYGACRMGRFLRLGGMVTEDGDGKMQSKYLYLIRGIRNLQSYNFHNSATSLSISGCYASYESYWCLLSSDVW